jgi:hypothetical protein
MSTMVSISFPFMDGLWPQDKLTDLTPPLAAASAKPSYDLGSTHRSAVPCQQSGQTWKPFGLTILNRIADREIGGRGNPIAV